MMNVYTAEIEIQLSTLLSNVCLPDCLSKRSWTGSTKWMCAKSLLPQRRPCLVLLQALRHNNNTIKCKKKTNGRKKEIGKKDDQALGFTSIKLLRDFIAFRFPNKLRKFQILWS